MGNKRPVVTPERFAQGMTFEQYVAYIGTPDNLKREGVGGQPRREWSEFMRNAYQATRLNDAQVEALKWIAHQPGAPARLLVISEEWSSDCRRDVPTLARLAEAAGLEMRIFTRDGQRFSSSQRPNVEGDPDSNADLMAQFMNYKNGQYWQSIPVAAFFTKTMEHLYTYIEYPAIYHKDRLLGHLRVPKSGEAREQAQERWTREFFELQASPFFKIWACAAVDEIITALHERLVVGSLE